MFGKEVEFETISYNHSFGMLNQVKSATLEDIKVVNEFPDVFLEELPSMPPKRDVEFIVELLPGTAPIAKRSYRMGVNELEEVKKQIKELQDKGYIHPSSSP
jgi:hypothetical protein